MQNNKSAKPIVEAGILSAIIIVLMIINYSFPILGTISMFILPIPMTLLSLRHNLRTAITGLVASTLLGAMIIGPIVAVSTLFLYGPMGITLGYCIKNNKGAVDSIKLTSIGSVFGLVAQYVIYAYLILGTNIKGAITEFYNMIMESITMSTKMYTSMGINLEENPAFKSLSNFTLEQLMLLIIPIALIGGISMAFLNYLVAKSILRRMKIEMKPLPPFSHWYIDSRYIAALIILFCLGVILESMGVKGAQYLYVAMLYLLQVSLLIVGLSAVSYYLMNKLHVSKGFAVIILIFTFSSFSIVYMILGFVETIMDGRDIIPNSLRKQITSKFQK